MSGECDTKEWKNGFFSGTVTTLAWYGIGKVVIYLYYHLQIGWTP